METNTSQLIIYRTPLGDTSVDVTVKGESIWLTQRQIAELFGTKVPAISKHLKNIFATGELQEDMVISKMKTGPYGMIGAAIYEIANYATDGFGTDSIIENQKKKYEEANF